MLKTGPSRLLEVYMDTNFCGNWNIKTKMHDNRVKYRVGFIILFAECPIIWASKYHSQTIFSTTEAKHITLSQSLRDVIPIMK